ncbi:MAG: MopE-related protein, partial [bacterium]|nr:MopE-related protein [bacterium]
MSGSKTFVRLAALATCVGLIGCKEQLGPSGNYLACDPEGQCASGYQCAQTELGAICLDDEQWQARCVGSETCNGLDDDCNGETDEGITDVVTGPDVGECAVRVERCTDGVLIAVEDGVLPTEETCNGLDVDCDGVADNDVAPRLSGFAIGECERSVVECMDGEYVMVDIGVEPTSERCDGLDNDCDGETDEDFMGSDDPDDEILVLGEPCTVGAGTCAADSVGVCDPSGLGVVCDAVAGNPSTELCDELDNDCDGEADETFAERGEDCSVGVGECRAEGVRACRSDGFGTFCDADAGESTDETCNGLDDDCDGGIDEELGDSCCISGTTRACGINRGACVAGTQTCSLERAWDSCSGTVPASETCDGED